MGMENCHPEVENRTYDDREHALYTHALIGFGMKRNPHSLGNHMRGRKLLWTTGPWNALPDSA